MPLSLYIYTTQARACARVPKFSKLEKLAGHAVCAHSLSAAYMRMQGEKYIYLIHARTYIYLHTDIPTYILQARERIYNSLFLSLSCVWYVALDDDGRDSSRLTPRPPVLLPFLSLLLWGIRGERMRLLLLLLPRWSGLYFCAKSIFNRLYIRGAIDCEMHRERERVCWSESYVCECKEGAEFFIHRECEFFQWGERARL